ncbi:MAG TPA: S16 family serine protease [Chthoniobacteraceae bacterium]|nr:S16 family serine protease [Chthoniobacteraceae bacterium]
MNITTNLMVICTILFLSISLPPAHGDGLQRYQNLEGIQRVVVTSDNRISILHSSGAATFEPEEIDSAFLKSWGIEQAKVIEARKKDSSTQNEATSGEATTGLPKQLAAVDAIALEYTGTLLDFCTWLNFKHHIPVSVDPALWERKSVLQEKRHFSKESGKSLADDLKDLARAENAEVMIMQGSIYITSSQPNRYSRYLPHLLKGRYSETAAALRADRQSSSDDPLLVLCEKVNAAFHRRATVKQTLATLSSQVRSSNFQAMTYRHGSSLSQPEPGRAVHFEKKIEENARTVRALIEEELQPFTDEVVSNDIKTLQNAVKSIPEWVVLKIYADYQAAVVDNLLLITGETKTMFHDSNLVIRALGSLKASIEEKRIHYLETAKHHAMLHAAASAVGKGAEPKRNYHLLVKLYDSFGDSGSRTRRLLAQRYAEINTLALKRKSQDNNPGTVPSSFPFGVGLTEEGARLLNSYLQTNLGKPAEKERPRPQIGLSYGLTVRKRDGEGVISIFSAELAKRRAQDQSRLSEYLKPLMVGDADEQIELLNTGDYSLDKYFISSIKDAVHYVSSNFDKNLFQNRVILSLDRSTDLAIGGDSAGAAIATALLSRLKKISPRPGVAMTGAIRSFGNIYPVGGICAKSLAVAKSGFGMLLIPEENRKDLELLPWEDMEGLQIILGKTMSDYLEISLPEVSGNRKMSRCTEVYAVAVNLYQLGNPGAALTLCNWINQQTDRHYSAWRLSRLLETGGVQEAVLSPEFFLPAGTAGPSASPAAKTTPKDSVPPSATPDAEASWGARFFEWLVKLLK